MSQRVVLCEGYDDRAFWTGWLQRLRCREAESQERLDEWGREVRGGRFLFYTPNGDRLVVEPCQSREQVPQAARVYFKAQATHPIHRLVLNIDSDTRVDPQELPEVGGVSEEIRHLILREQADEERNSSTVQGIEILPVVWECADRSAPGIPDQQSLERMVCAAIVEAYPGRGDSVDRWLTDPPVGDSASAKAHGLSYLAKWYASHGTIDFYAHVWRDRLVAEALEHRLRATGAWATVERLIAP